MNKQDTITLIHEEISSVLHTTQEFTLKDTEELVDKLISVGVLYTDEVALMELIDMARDDIAHGRVTPAGSVMKRLKEKINEHKIS